MSDNKDGKVFSCDFDIKSKVPPEVIAKFTEAQAKLLGMRGWIEQTAEGVRGNLQTQDKANIEKMEKVLKQAEQFKDLFKDIAFAKIKEIEKFTHDKFEQLKK